MPIYQYRCECGYVTEAYSPYPDGGTPWCICAACENRAEKIPSWVAHRRKEKGMAYPIPEQCK